MHGIGNDFIVIDNFSGRVKLNEEQVKSLCDRHKGIGADGVILVETYKEGSEKIDCFMNYINSDGSLAKMCGNGIRCTARFLKDECLKDKNVFKIQTRDGLKEIKWESGDIFSVNMGKAEFYSEDYNNAEKEIEGLSLNFVSVGNPFAVAFVENIEKYDLAYLGPIIENHKSFPNKINFELVEKIGENELKVKVWERGCGLVLACGTGACSAFALLQKEKSRKEIKGEKVIIHLPGGDLHLSENKEGEIIMSGPAVSSFNGMVEL